VDDAGAVRCSLETRRKELFVISPADDGWRVRSVHNHSIIWFLETATVCAAAVPILKPTFLKMAPGNHMLAVQD